MKNFAAAVLGRPRLQKIMVRGAMMGIHSEILVHWTGKDIESGAVEPQPYVQRLKDDLQNGLYTERRSEASIRKTKIKNLVRICFTEIRLGQVQAHAARYGKLGIGFSRDFVMQRGGRPVLYVPYEPNPGGSVLEDSIRSLYDYSKDHEEVAKPLKWVMAHVKRMSDWKGEGETRKEEYYYDEMEWRLVYDERPDNTYWTHDAGRHRLVFAPGDVKVIILPDESTKNVALKDGGIATYFCEHMPIMATLDDCSNF